MVLLLNGCLDELPPRPTSLAKRALITNSCSDAALFLKGRVPMGNTVGLYDGHSLAHPAPCHPPGAAIPGLPLSEEDSQFSAPRCVLFCRVLAVSLLVI